MKGQSLIAAQNAKLIAVNLRYIMYAMKEGNMRIINQNGKDMFKLSIGRQAKITDLVANGTGVSSKEQGTTLICCDDQGCITIFLLDYFSGGSSGEERVRRITLDFTDDEKPKRAVGHPTDNKVFFTLHDDHIRMWSIPKLGQPDDAVALAARLSGETVRLGGEDGVASRAFLRLVPPPPGARVLDAAVSVDGLAIVVLTSDGAATVWRFPTSAVFDTAALALKEPEILQHVVLDESTSSSICSLRAMGDLDSQGIASPENGQLLVAASASGCELYAFELCPLTSKPLGRLLQVVHVDAGQPTRPAGAIEGEPACQIDVNSITRSSLAMTSPGSDFVLLMPLAKGWKCVDGMPFPYVQRLTTTEPSSQIATMTGKSYETMGQTLFMYCAHNFKREKDNLPGCNVVVREVEQPNLVAREAAIFPPSWGSFLSPGGPSTASQEPVGADAGQDLTDGVPEVQAAPSDVSGAAAATSGDDAGVPEENVPSCHQPDPEPAAAVAPADAPAPSMPAAEAPSVPTVMVRGVLPRPIPGLAASSASAPFGGMPPLVDLRLPPHTVIPSVGGAASSTDAAANAVSLAATLADSTGEEDAEEPIDGGAGSMPNATTNGAGGLEEGRSSRQRGGSGKQDVDWGMVKHIAASFVRGLERRRGELADKIVSEVAELVKEAPAGSGEGGAADVAILEQALAKIREARAAQAAGERGVQAAAKKASEAWAEASQNAIAGMLQKELGKVSDGVASSLAQQLTQSKKFCEALAKGVQKSGGAATKQALEALRPPKQLQGTVANALSEALHDSLGPVLRTELRTHFEQELAPLIGQRVAEMMGSFRDRMGECLEGIAAEHTQAAKRLGQDLAPVVQEELKQVAIVVAQHRSAAAAEGGAAASAAPALSEAQLDELARAVRAEVVQPLHARIRDLTAQVKRLHTEIRELEQRWRAANATNATGGGVVPNGPAGSMRFLGGTPESEAAQAADLEQAFEQGRVEEAFGRAIALQPEAKYEDFVWRLCTLIRGPVDQWLAGDGHRVPLNMHVKMHLMLTLARQLASSSVADGRQSVRIDWINELWLAFEVDDPTVKATAGNSCSQLIELLDTVDTSAGEDIGDQVRRLKRAVNQAARILQTSK